MAENRTEKATGRRRQRAHDQGQFAYSQELTAALILFACLAAIFYRGLDVARFRSFFESVLQAADSADSSEAITALIRQSGVFFLTVSSPILAAAIVAALAGNVLQGLPVFGKEKPTLNWEALNLVAGLSRLKTRVSPLEWVKILLLVLMAGAVLWSTSQLYISEVIASPAVPIQASNSLVRTILLHVITYVGLGIAVLATGDFFLQRLRFEKSIKQTKAEVKEDMKALEGNPQMKGKIRSLQRERARRRMMARVKDADVIVTNPTHYAVALEYKPGMSAPRVLAKGRGWLAQKIKELGREHDIPTVENVSLARALYRSVEVEQEIPAELYKAVAEVLAFVFRIRKRV